jgi:hypothetical protein
VDTGLQEALDTLRRCIQQAFDRCVANNDPLEATWMLQLSLQLQALGEDDPLLTTFIEGGLLERCLRFELDFESKVVEQATRASGEATTTDVQRLKYRSQHVPLRLNYSGAGNIYGRSVWEGTCSLLPEDAAFYYVTGGFGCTVTVNPGQSVFSVAAAWIGIPTDEAVRFVYDPGNPTPTASATCPSGDIPDFPIIPFIDDYGRLHEGEIDLVGPAATIIEETFFFLKHTPDAPMPDCP